MRFSIYQESRQGGRSNNEDRISYCYSRDSLLMVVADGMGGHHYGEVAAQIAVQSITDAFQREARSMLADPFAFLRRSMLNAHYAILDYAARNELEDSPRTTCVACIVQDGMAHWAHAGDSRLFLMRDGKLLVQTKDHSRVRLLVEQGVISPAVAAVHPDRNKIYSCLGSPTMPEIDQSRRTPLDHGDIIVLCTDGLWGIISGERLAGILHNSDILQTVPTVMLQAETKAGAYGDNLSAVVMRWEDHVVEPESSIISTQTMPLGEFTTKLDDFGKAHGTRSELSDDEIEKAIEEIRSTIDKYTPKK